MSTPASEPPTHSSPSESRWAFLRRRGYFTTGLAAGIVMLLVGATGIAGFRLGADAGVRGLPQGFENVEALFETIEQDAVNAPDAEELVEGAINGLLGSLDDPYAVYYDPERYDQLNADLDGEFVGIGVRIEERADGIYIVGVFRDSPAEEAGVRVGERIVAVDGQNVLDGDTTADVVGLIAGDAGTTVDITFDSGPAGERTLTLTREVLQLPEVTTRVLDSGFGYAGVVQFSRNVDSQLLQQVNRLQEEEDITGLVMDLRGNPGGLLIEAVEVVSLFVEEGTVVQVESREGSVEREASGNTPLADIPLVVLVDGNSASASEIVAGALQELGRARVVGTQTFGKGTVQTIQDLDFGAGVKFTTAQYFLPDGDSIEGVGVTPDVITGDDPDEQLAEAEDVLSETLAEGPSEQ